MPFAANREIPWYSWQMLPRGISIPTSRDPTESILAEYFLLGMARETLLISLSAEIKEKRALLACTQRRAAIHSRTGARVIVASC